MPTSEHIRASKDSFQTNEPLERMKKIHFNEQPIRSSKGTLNKRLCYNNCDFLCVKTVKKKTTLHCCSFNY